MANKTELFVVNYGNIRMPAKILLVFPKHFIDYIVFIVSGDSSRYELCNCVFKIVIDL